jgi:hypothetical protein
MYWTLLKMKKIFSLHIHALWAMTGPLSKASSVIHYGEDHSSLLKFKHLLAYDNGWDIFLLSHISSWCLISQAPGHLYLLAYDVLFYFTLPSHAVKCHSYKRYVMKQNKDLGHSDDLLLRLTMTVNSRNAIWETLLKVTQWGKSTTEASMQ